MYSLSNLKLDLLNVRNIIELRMFACIILVAYFNLLKPFYSSLELFSISKFCLTFLWSFVRVILFV